MNLLFSMANELWQAMAPSTWFLILGLLVSIDFLKKVLF